MKQCIYLLIGVYICLASCQKEVSTYKESDSIVIGNYHKLKITKFDTTISGSYNNPASINLDIDGDKIPDLRFLSEVWGSLGLGQHPRSSVLSLNPNCLLYIIITIDTNFLHRETTVTPIPNSTMTQLDYYKVYSCRRIDVKDIINTIYSDQYAISYKLNGERLLKTDSFKLANFYLVDDTYFFPSAPVFSNDTFYQNHTIYDYTCHNLPSNTMFYLGIKIKNTTSEKLGWLKLSVSNNKTITIYESGIQK